MNTPQCREADATDSPDPNGTTLSHIAAVSMPDHLEEEPSATRREYIPVGSAPDSRRRRSRKTPPQAAPTLGIALKEGRLSPAPLNVLFEDQHLVAVDKPAGLLVHRSSVDKHESLFLLQQLRDQIGAHVFPVHRLDKPTSGVIVFAKSPRVAALLQAQMMAQPRNAEQVRKQYLLVCRGYAPEAGVINHALKPIDPFKSKRGKSAGERPAQAAVTHYQRLHTVELDTEVDKYPRSRYSLVLAELITGRKHQLRRHFKHLAHPIIGCPKYGKSSHNRYFADNLGVPRLLLHAYRLAFVHPLTQQAMDISALPSGTFAALLERFDWTLPEPAK